MNTKQLLDKAYGKSRMWEMANLKPEETGLPVIVYVSDKGNSQHGPRIKVQNDYSSKVTNDWFSITIETNAKVPNSQSHIKIKVKDKDLVKVKQWISLNKDLLLKYWNGAITTTTFIKEFKKLS